ncbi:MAG: hypothetical protein IKI16_06980 [Prevotella sp.]|nr:hypothetical protein [Prevotella sp.]
MILRPLLLLLCCWWLTPCIASRYNYNTDSLLRVLDGVINSSKTREAVLWEKTKHHQQRLCQATTDAERFVACQRVYRDFHRLQLDSALRYARMVVAVARQLKHPDSLAKAQLIEAEALKCLGHHHKALEILKNIPHSDYLRNTPSYYYQFHSNLLSLWEIAPDATDKQYYKKLMNCYRDSIELMHLDSETSLAINQSEVLKEHGQYQEALRLLQQVEATDDGRLEKNAIFWFSIGDAYEKTGDKERAKYCYTMAAIIDKRRCSKTYTALQNLAMLLFNEGETDRAYRYITVSLNDVISSGARQRLALVAEYLPIITSAHDLEQQKVAEKRNTIIAVVSVSAVIMALLLLLLYRHNQRLTAMRLQLIESNNKLQQLNGELNMVNSALQESNKIKEVYIAQLFNLCSEHIDKTEHLRLSIMNKLKGGLQKEVVKQLSQSTSNETLRAFFHRFDAIFLQLFPDFIEKFNALLQPGEQLQVKDGALLSPELRIYALVRLGITDSTKIASFLHYSSQTVYNYRQKIRNKANIDKATFVAKIQSL